VFLGDGNDSITADIGSNSYAIVNYNAIETEDGDDIITSTGGIYNNGIINTGNGNDLIVDTAGVWGINNEGANVITGDDGGNINTGDGEDSIISQFGINNKGGVFLGDDNDIITTAGVIVNSGVIETGNGDDSIIVDITDGPDRGYGIYNNGSINTGDGNDSIIANEGFESAPNSSGSWFLGEGEDYIKGFGRGEFSGGNGNDTLELTSGTYIIGRWYTAVTFTKGSSIMIASEFEELIAGSTSYDFTSLTKGQTITVA
jgi:hypothetical protein